MLTGIKLQAYPTKEQAEILSRWIGCARLIYNDKVAFDREARRLGKTPLIDQSYARSKTQDRPFLKELPSQILRNSAVRYYQAYLRFTKGLSGRPTFKKRGSKDSIWLTSELFSFCGERLYVGTKKFPFGELSLYCHAPFQPPNSLVIRRDGEKWFVSFCYEITTKEPLRTEEELLYEASLLSEDELRARTLAYDRGVAIPLQTSNGNSFTFPEIVQRRTLRRERIIGRERRSLERKRAMRTEQPDSKRYQKTKARIKRAYEYGRNARDDFAHKTSHTLAESQFQVFVEEDLKIPQMVKRPKAKQDHNGKWLKNGRRAKARLNRGILRSAWSKSSRFLQYKAARRNKLLIKVSPWYSSQECAVCHFCHPDNRQSQAFFECQSCGHTDHADTNAALNHRERGIELILASKVEKKKAKKIGGLRKKSKTLCRGGIPETTHGES